MIFKTCVRTFALIALLGAAWAASAQGYTKTETIEYHDQVSIWVLGQVAKVACVAPTAPLPAGCGPAGTIISETTYDAAYALPLTSTSFGKVKQIVGYDTTSSVASGQRGTLKTVANGNNKIIHFGSWRRGIPQAVTFPATDDQPTPVMRTAVVNDAGWIISVNDENGDKTCYGYDAMGRINKVTYPSEAANVCDESEWGTTAVTFQPGYPASYGMPAGHWRETTLTGRGRKIVIYDALWRPVVEQAVDLDRASTTTSEIIKRYDAAGRLEFQSYPMNTGGTAVYTDTSLKGTHTTYDALDRITSVKQDSELGVLTTTTAYLSNATGMYSQVTNPRGAQVRTWYQAYDRPAYDAPVIIQYAGTAFTDIVRDPLGKPTSIKLRNGNGSTSETRTYTYDTYQQLCRQVEPETGATLLGYDGADNLAWSASGLPANTACNANGNTAAIMARKVNRTYDARDRLKTLAYPNSEGNQLWNYTSDSLPSSIVTTMLSDPHIVTNQYTYNRRRLLASELQKLTNWGTYVLTHNYNANGHLASLVFPANYLGSIVEYAPNALGQPTKAGTFASVVNYHPSGAIKSFTYGNGLKHTLVQNVRGFPDTSCDFASTCNTSAVLNDGYDYDHNGNVMAISDGRTNRRGDRTMTYDALDRLITTVSPMFGTATYAYDALNNLTRTKLTAGNQIRDHYYCYDAKWQLTNVKTSSCTGDTIMGLGYDVQGNLANRNGVVYKFDYGNRLREVVGREKQYWYDGHGRRVASNRLVNGSSVRRSIYGLDGKLLFTQDQGEAKRTEYIYLGGGLIAERSLPNSGAGTPVSIRYQHTDALGSPVAITNESRGVVESTEYEPYGWAANRLPRSGPGYTGHHEDAATGLVYMQQRYYDPGIGRFLSIDPVTALSNPVGMFNRYKYAANNPYRFTDLDGRYEEDVHRDLTSVLAQAAGASIGIANQIAAGDQGVDDNPATSPMGMRPYGDAVQVRADFHFTSPGRREQLYQDFKKSGSPATMGKYLHALQDSSSHAGYGARFGHLSDGHAPDKTYNDIAKADGMARATYNTILNSRGAFSVGGQTVSFGKAVPWGRIAPLVHDFNAAKSSDEKRNALAALRKAFD
ncbi:MAG: RHS repeat domain-containing protein [Luteimonas sp.]